MKNKSFFKRARKKSGFADTRKYPHRNHPARYNSIGNDEIEYITFTHHDCVKIKDKDFYTIPLNSNIDKKERLKNKYGRSYAFPKVYVGKRSSLGKENKNYSFVDNDSKLVSDLFKTLPRERVPYSSNSKKK